MWMFSRFLFHYPAVALPVAPAVITQLLDWNYILGLRQALNHCLKYFNFLDVPWWLVEFYPSSLHAAMALDILYIRSWVFYSSTYITASTAFHLLGSAEWYARFGTFNVPPAKRLNTLWVHLIQEFFTCISFTSIWYLGWIKRQVN